MPEGSKPEPGSKAKAYVYKGFSGAKPPVKPPKQNKPSIQSGAESTEETQQK